jgi:hypothetical protein
MDPSQSQNNQMFSAGRQHKFEKNNKTRIEIININSFHLNMKKKTGLTQSCVSSKLECAETSAWVLQSKQWGSSGPVAGTRRRCKRFNGQLTWAAQIGGQEGRW